MDYRFESDVNFPPVVIWQWHFNTYGILFLCDQPKTLPMLQHNALSCMDDDCTDRSQSQFDSKQCMGCVWAVELCEHSLP